MTVQLLVNGQPQADARLSTLPPQLPTLEEKPFTVLLGSAANGRTLRVPWARSAQLPSARALM
jgi:hypothetical protein